MANKLQVQEQEAINRLAALGWSIRRIAREFKLHRKTVRAYLPEQTLDSKCPTISTAGKVGRKSLCDFHAKLIAQKLHGGLQQDNGFGGSYEAVKRFVRQFKQQAPHQVWRIEVQPAEEAQVDFIILLWMGR